MNQLKKCALFFGILFVAFARCDNIYGNIINKNVNRNIDLTTQLVRETNTITLENGDSKAASSFYLTFESKLSEHLSYLEVTQSGKQLVVSKPENGKSTDGKYTFTQYKVDLAKPIESKGETVVVVKAVFTHAVSPYPASIAQTEKQLVRFSGNHFFFSPYSTTTQTSIVKLSSGNIESKTDKNPTSAKGDTITYGPYADIVPYSHSRLDLHFENNKPFLTATKLVKEIEVSHWGNLAIEATYDVLRDDGATLKGTFSRYDYQRNPAGSPAVVPVFKTILPISAEDVYYRDEIGNITSSHMNVNQRGLVVDLIPRFPLFGGWKTAFYFGYNLPLHQYLSTSANDGSLYVLNTTFSVNTDDVVVDELVVRVILPEGASNVNVHTPFPIDAQSSATHFTYLDTSGRPVVVITKKNVVADHDKFFQVTYNFSSFGMFREPILLIGAYFFFFLSVMAYVRFNFQVGPTKVRKANEEKIADILSRFRDITDQRNEQHASLESALNKAFKAKSEAQYQTEKKRVEQNLNALKKEVTKIISELEEVDIDTARKIKDLERKQEKKVVSQDQLHNNEISYRLNKRIPKTTYEDLKADYEKAYSQVDEDIEGVIADLTENL